VKQLQAEIQSILGHDGDSVGQRTTSIDPLDATVSQARSQNPTSLVSWAHRGEDWGSAEGEEWQRQVTEFTAQLRQLGVEADLDLYHLHDDDIDWTRFGPQAIANVEYVIIAISVAWSERWSGSNNPREGAGAAAEADTLHGLFNKDQADWQRRTKIVLLPGIEADAVPPELERVTRFHVDPESPDSFEDLIRTLTGQPLHAKPAVGAVPTLPPKALSHREQSKLSKARDSGQVREQLVAEVNRLSQMLERDSSPAVARRLREQRAMLQGTLEAMAQWSSEQD